MNVDFRLIVDPALGGSVLGLWHKGKAVLRDGRGSSTPTDSAGFPMVPFAGRITDGWFRWNDQDVQLAKNFPPEPHAIHGEGWQGAWAVQMHTDNRLELVFDNDGKNWPWRYRAQQRFRLTDDGLVYTLEVTNLDPSPMPAGIGWHPYFPAQDLALTTETKQGTFAGPMPTGLDTVYDWPAPRADITTPAGQVQMQADPLFTTLVVYSPGGESYACVEPLSHKPNAVNATDPARQGVKILQSGESLRGTVRLTLRP